MESFKGEKDARSIYNFLKIKHSWSWNESMRTDSVEQMINCGIGCMQSMHTHVCMEVCCHENWGLTGLNRVHMLHDYDPIYWMTVFYRKKNLIDKGKRQKGSNSLVKNKKKLQKRKLALYCELNCIWATIQQLANKRVHQTNIRLPSSISWNILYSIAM